MDFYTQPSNTQPRIQYVADGTNTIFEIPFVIFDTHNLNVFFDNQQKTTGFSITIDKKNQPKITFKTPPPANTVITFVRVLSLERVSDFQEGGALRASTLNHEFDYQMACLQQVADSASRAMVLPAYAASLETDLTLPHPSAGKAILWNEDGTNLVNSEVEINAISEVLDEKVNTVTTAAAMAAEKADSAAHSAASAIEKANLATEQANIATEQANLALEIVGGAGGSTEIDLSTITAENAHSLIGNRVWISGEYPITASARTIATHNLNLENPLMARGEVFLKCVSPELGYVAGEFASNWFNTGLENGFIWPLAKGSTLTRNTIETSTGYGLGAIAKTGNTYSFPTAAKWRYVFRVCY